MCVVAVSKAGARQPSIAELVRCFNNNGDGAGYMYARENGDGKVHIRKGFMDIGEFIEAVYNEHFTAADAVVYHFRISTQAGVKPEMTHPFPVTGNLDAMKILSCRCDMAVAHNGVIPLTSRKDELTYSDTALFIAGYMSTFYRRPNDLYDDSLLALVSDLAGKSNKFAIMNGDGTIQTVGKFEESDGVLYSNNSYSTAYKKYDWADWYTTGTYAKTYKGYKNYKK